MNQLVLATKNRGKIREIRSILEDLGIKISSLDDYNQIPQITESGKTLEQNAVKKAVTVAKCLGLFALADDSGLEVDWLDGVPGVLSARFAGESATYEDNNRKLLDLLKGVPPQKRTATFRCVMALASPEGRFWTVEGECKGIIAEELRGTQGFGYDPLFIVPQLGKTFAELEPSVKNRISHRAKALRKLKDLLAEVELESI